MDTTPQDFSHLFEQLGLESHVDSIDKFIADHTIPANVLIYQAEFWNGSQKTFIKEAIEEDAQWSEIIDQLDALLR